MTACDLRLYHVVDGGMPALQRVLREVALPIMADHGMHAVGCWAGVDGATLYQMTRHVAAEAIDSDWAALHADPRWQAGLNAIRGERSAVRHVETIVLTGIAGLPPMLDPGDAR